MVARPRSSAGWSASFRSTGIPALARTMAMPPPMVPAPTTAADFMGISGVSLGMSGILPTSRSLKKTWMRALDWSEKRHSAKSFCSSWQPSANGNFVAASMASMAATGASRPRCFLATVSRAAEKIAAFVRRRCRVFRCARAFWVPGWRRLRGQTRLPQRADRLR